jgi:hypothetical protein
MSSLHRVILLILSFFFSFRNFAQNPNSFIDHPGRYRLDLPKEWVRPKMIRALTDILPQTIDELKDRDFCTAGKATYLIRLVIDSLSVRNEQTTLPVEIGSIPHYTFSFSYSFHAALLMTDSLRKPVSMLQLISSNETMDYSRQFTLPPQNQVFRHQPVYDSSGRAIGSRLVEEAPAVNNYVPKLSAYSVLTYDFLLGLCEKKIFEIKRLLKRMNPD